MADDGTSDAVRDRFASWSETESGEAGTDRNEKRRKNRKIRRSSGRGECETRVAESQFLPARFPLGHADRRYKYPDLTLDEEFGHSTQKTCHYYPSIVELGLERFDE